MSRRARVVAGAPPNPIARLAVNIRPAQANMIRVGALGRRQARHRLQLPVTGIGIARGTHTNRVGRHNPVIIERPHCRARVVVGRDVRRIRVNRRRRSKYIRRMAIDDKPCLLGAVVVPAQSHVRRLRAVRSRQTRRFRRRPRQGRHIGHRRVAPRAFRPGRRHPPVVRHRIRQPRHHHARARHRQVFVTRHIGEGPALHHLELIQVKAATAGNARFDLNFGRRCAARQFNGIGRHAAAEGVGHDNCVTAPAIDGYRDDRRRAVASIAIGIIRQRGRPAVAAQIQTRRDELSRRARRTDFGQPPGRG